MREMTTILALGMACGIWSASAAAETQQDASKPAAESAAAPQEKATPAPIQEAKSEPEAKQRPVLYRPPKVGKPARSVGGGTRGHGDREPVLFALVPDHVGQTATAQPSLFWFLDRILEPGAKVEFTFISGDDVDPQIEVELETPTSVGVQRIRLEDYGVELTPGVEYEWSVAVVLDPSDPSKDVVATGWIDRIDRTDLAELIQGAGTDSAPQIYAEEGLWYDALASVEDRIGGGNDPGSWVAVRESLLKQVGLEVVVSASL